MNTHVHATLKFDEPVTRTYVYQDGTQEPFREIRKLTVMRTGCHMLEVKEGKRVYIVHTGWRYIIQE